MPWPSCFDGTLTAARRGVAAFAGRDRRRRWLSCALVAALVLSQALGLIHRVVHAPHLVSATAVAWAEAAEARGEARVDDGHGHGHGHGHSAHPDHHARQLPQDHQDHQDHQDQRTWAAKGAPAGAGWLAQLFSGADHADHCPLYDQLGQADGLSAPLVLGLGDAPGEAVPDEHIPAAIAAQSAGYLARGPPVKRVG